MGYRIFRVEWQSEIDKEWYPCMEWTSEIAEAMSTQKLCRDMGFNTVIREGVENG